LAFLTLLISVLISYFLLDNLGFLAQIGYGFVLFFSLLLLVGIFYQTYPSAQRIEKRKQKALMEWSERRIYLRCNEIFDPKV